MSLFTAPLFLALLNDTSLLSVDSVLSQAATPYPTPTPVRQPTYSFERDSSETRYEIELPGVRKDSVSLDVKERTLVLTADRFRSVPSKKTSVSLLEDRPASGAQGPQNEQNEGMKPTLKYRLVLRLDHTDDSEAISAVFEHAVLIVRVPIKEQPEPRKIEIGQ